MQPMLRNSWIMGGGMRASYNRYYKPTEAMQCKALAAYLKLWEHTHPEKRLVWFHVPNEGKRSVMAGRELKSIGLKAGVADYVLIFPSKTIFVEVKSEKGTLSASQEEFRKDVESKGYRYVVVRNIDELEKILNVIDI